ncbi:CotH kinase family protein [Candidatus Galacturonibacter soehngenii]|uniref:Spore coat protein CotH n=1 Tax=Candidatus Galacturonatibacter soehngenii TaxID=2307010 RepID=A0A7V7QKD2_9FIRM|nr:CotH kinase family protein [Candidatus Galacturonibacter soehngenii]KAB1438218.1 hypothetical protein F7O84_11740 [Candidatus Galacturonibacter soehngenii]
MKKIVFIINVILFALVCLFFIVGIDQNDSIQCNIGTPKSIAKIEENTRLTTDDILQNLYFNGEALPYDKESSTFYLPLSMKNEGWEYGELTSNANEASILFTNDFKKVSKLEAIANNESFSFLAFTKQEHRYYHIVFTGLPIMDIKINAGDFLESASIDMTLYSADTKSEWVQHSMANIRVRGNTSRIYPKKGYKLELTKYNNSGNIVNHNLSLLNMRKDNDWILYAMYNDNTKIRDKLSIDIWNQFGAKDNPYSREFGTKLEYVELVVDGDYYGIYGLMEPVDAKMLDITKSNEAESQEYIYKRTDPIVLSLDYFMEESDVLSRCGFELKGISKYGDISLKTWKPLSDFIRVHNLEDEEYVKEIDNTIDINSVTNAWLFFQIISGLDNRAKNVYYVAKMTDSGIRLFFVPWDMDLTWGNVSKEKLPPTFTAYEPEIMTEVANWETGQRVIDLNAGNSIAIVKEKWNLLRGSILTNDALIKNIENLEHTVVNSGAMDRDTKRWPEGAHTTDYTDIKQYAIDKMEFLDSYFATLTEE